MLDLSDKPLDLDSLNQDDFDELIGAYHEAFYNLLSQYRADTMYLADDIVEPLNKVRKEYEIEND